MDPVSTFVAPTESVPEPPPIDNLQGKHDEPSNVQNEHDHARHEGDGQTKEEGHEQVKAEGDDQVGEERPNKRQRLDNSHRGGKKNKNKNNRTWHSFL
jgi:hypothetical protein